MSTLQYIVPTLVRLSIELNTLLPAHENIHGLCIKLHCQLLETQSEDLVRYSGKI